MIRTLIVDDEPLARAMLRALLRTDQDFEVAGECENGAEAVGVLQRGGVDLVFLDVQMPELDGFAVLEAMRGSMPRVVFVTAYDQYAVRAFDAHALDYLLKPLNPERFHGTLARVKAQRGEPLGMERRLQEFLDRQRTASLERLLVRDGERLVFVRCEEVEWIEAEGNYIVLHVGKHRHLIREPISGMEARLDPRRFQRVNRSAIVNLDFVREMHPWFRGDYKLLLKDGTELKLSHRYRSALVDRFAP